MPPRRPQDQLNPPESDAYHTSQSALPSSEDHFNRYAVAIGPREREWAKANPIVNTRARPTRPPVPAFQEDSRLRLDPDLVESQNTGLTQETAAWKTTGLPTLAERSAEFSPQAKVRAHINTRRALEDRSDNEEDVLSYAATKELYLSAFQEDADKFIKLFIQQETLEATTIAAADTDMLEGHIWLIIMSSEPLMHEALMRGDFTEKYRNEPAFIEVVNRMQERATTHPRQPRIYANFLVDKRSGRSISVEKLHQLSEAAIRYVLEDEFAIRVDAAIGSSIRKRYSRQGARKYLNEQRGNYCNFPNPVRTTKLGIFCRAIQRRCEEIPKEQWHLPIRGAFSEFGYSGEALARLLQHEAHVSSNYLMNIFEAISKALLHDELVFERFVIYHIPCLELVELAEMYFTRMGQGYAKNGGGFSHAAAGRSTNSRYDFDQEDYTDFWKYAEDETPMLQVVQQYHDRKEAATNAILASNKTKREAYEKKLAQFEELERLQAILATHFEDDATEERVRQELIGIRDGLRACVLKGEELLKEEEASS